MTRLAYILSASHSGSTLTAMLLAGHPDVCTAGELKLTSLGDISTYRCSCGAMIHACSFWTGIKEDLARRGMEFDIRNPRTDFRSGCSHYQLRLLQPLCRGPLLEAARDGALALSRRWSGHVRRIQERNRALAECISLRHGAKVVVDSSKIGIRLKYLLRTPGLDVRVIRLVRDGRAVALTYTDPARFADASNPDFRGGGSGGSREGERVSMVRAAREWRRSNEEAEAIIRTLPRCQYVEIRYEELCRNTADTLGRVFEALGVEPTRAPADLRSVEHHVVGNGMRLDSTAEIRLDERWRSELDSAALTLFEETAGAMNRRYGYQ